VESLQLQFGGTADAPGVTLDGTTVRLLLAVGLNTVIWVVTTLLTHPEKKETLYAFYRKTKPGGPGWSAIRSMAEQEGVDLEGGQKGKPWELPYEILCVFLGTLMIYCCLFSIGSFVYGKPAVGIGLAAGAVACCWGLFTLFGRTRILCHTHERRSGNRLWKMLDGVLDAGSPWKQAL
jgi:hypothetical protein